MLGDLKTRALSGLHAFSGADITGSMSGKGKYNVGIHSTNAKSSVNQALSKLGYVQLEDFTKMPLNGM